MEALKQLLENLKLTVCLNHFPALIEKVEKQGLSHVLVLANRIGSA